VAKLRAAALARSRAEQQQAKDVVMRSAQSQGELIAQAATESAAALEMLPRRLEGEGGARRTRWMYGWLIGAAVVMVGGVWLLVERTRRREREGLLEDAFRLRQWRREAVRTFRACAQRQVVGVRGGGAGEGTASRRAKGGEEDGAFFLPEAGSVRRVRGGVPAWVCEGRDGEGTVWVLGNRGEDVGVWGSVVACLRASGWRRVVVVEGAPGVEETRGAVRDSSVLLASRASAVAKVLEREGVGGGGRPWVVVGEGSGAWGAQLFAAESGALGAVLVQPLVAPPPPSLLHLEALRRVSQQPTEELASAEEQRGGLARVPVLGTGQALEKALRPVGPDFSDAQKAEMDATAAAALEAQSKRSDGGASVLAQPGKQVLGTIAGVFGKAGVDSVRQDHAARYAHVARTTDATKPFISDADLHWISGKKCKRAIIVIPGSGALPTDLQYAARIGHLRHIALGAISAAALFSDVPNTNNNSSTPTPTPATPATPATPTPTTAGASDAWALADGVRSFLDAAGLVARPDASAPVGALPSVPGDVRTSMERLVEFATLSLAANPPNSVVGRLRATTAALHFPASDLWVLQAPRAAAVSIPIVAPAAIAQACNEFRS
jgi:hypothetical protein